MKIRTLDPVDDLEKVVTFYADAPDYWILSDGLAPGREKATAFFTDGPPNCDPAKSHRLGLFLGDRLSGLAELSFGFPEPNDAYFGFMMLGPWARGAGHGRAFLAHVEGLAREAKASQIYVAVLESNPRGRAFWEREGFTATGVSGVYSMTGQDVTVNRLGKAL